MKAFKCDGCERYGDGDPFTLGELCGSCVAICHGALDAPGKPDAEPEPQLPPGNWISVKDGLPANDKAVHAIYGGGVYDGDTIWLVRYHGGNSERDAHWLWNDRSDFHGTGRITHWKPIKR